MPGQSGWYPGRCRDCARKAKKGASRCKECAAERRAAAAKLRAERRRKRLCVTCGKPAVVLPDGAVMGTCERHREYFRARDEAARKQRAG